MAVTDAIVVAIVPAGARTPQKARGIAVETVIRTANDSMHFPLSAIRDWKCKSRATLLSIGFADLEVGRLACLFAIKVIFHAKRTSILRDEQDAAD